MSWSGGTYRKGNYGTNGWTGDASLGIGIEAGRHDTQDDDFANGINACLAKDGSNSATGNLNLGGTNRITNLASGVASTDAATLGQVQSGIPSYLGTTGGTSTAFTVTATPTITALTTGAQYVFKANAANGAAATLKIDGTAATTMQRQGTALAGNEFKANDFVSVVYDGTNFQITNIATAPLYVDRTNNRVGIGTTAPADTLEVATTGFWGQYISAYTGASAGGNNIAIRRSRGATVGANTILQNADIVGSLDFQAANGTTFTSAANIAAVVDGTPGATNDMPGRLVFSTTADGAGSPTERMRINNTGCIGINTTSSADTRVLINGVGTTSTTYSFTTRNSSSQALFQVRDDGLINTGTWTSSPYNLTTVVGANVNIDANGTFFRSTSSAKYKTDIKDASYGLTEVLALRPVTYKGKSSDGPTVGGLIAEEVDAAGLTEFVVYAQDGSPDALNYGNMVSLAFKAIQELNAKVEALEARIAALEA